MYPLPWKEMLVDEKLLGFSANKTKEKQFSK